MAKIKIISNPYRKITSFQRWDEDNDEWIAIKYDNNGASKLLSEQLSKGFFPFHVRQIVEQIVQDYKIPNEAIHIVFEGSADEYKELTDALVECSFDVEVVTERSSVGLENARDILPEVKQLFQQITPLINSSVDSSKIQRDLERFSDASSDVVPICVLGNYSAGKSTFINALIGCEILPSGTEPITAKVYKISRSKFEDRALVKCKYLNKDVLITFSEKETIIEQDGSNLSNALNKGIAELEENGIVERVNKIIAVINNFDDSSDEKISDLIEVEIPFAQGVLANSPHPFVIIDTPGSNSASNSKHRDLLKEAMANMTNGLPIFVCTPDSLDSTDNENLYQLIRELEELDNRFTMIVVNKADNAGIQRRGDPLIEQKRILNQSVPRNLYSGGLYYVSSILGLGGKTEGSFMDYVYEDVYDAQEERYRNPANRHYRQLYMFNILPSQIKSRSDHLSSEHPNLIYANSGLFAIETEIETFAGKYAAYNKCFQSQMFLQNIIDITEDEIEMQKDDTEDIRQEVRNKLEIDKKQLLEQLITTSEDEQQKGDDSYDLFMKGYLDQGKDTFSHKKLKDMERAFTEEQEEKQDFNGSEKAVHDAVGTVAENLKSNVNQVLKAPSLNMVKDVVKGLASDVGDVVDKSKSMIANRRDVDKAAANKLVAYVGEEYETKLSDLRDLLDSKSQEYWTGQTERIRHILGSIVTGAETLTEERRHELERIIITFQPIAFKENTKEEIFNKNKFEIRIRVGGRTVLEFDHLNIDKIARTYNSFMDENIGTLYITFKESHTESAHRWIQNLMDEISQNIVEYSPELSKQAKRIQRMTHQIEDLQDRKEKLKRYTEQLYAMMDWKDVESLRG